MINRKIEEKERERKREKKETEKNGGTERVNLKVVYFWCVFIQSDKKTESKWPDKMV